MLAKLRFPGLLLVLSVALFAQRAMSVVVVITLIKSQIKANGDDKATADYLHRRSSSPSGWTFARWRICKDRAPDPEPPRP